MTNKIDGNATNIFADPAPLCSVFDQKQYHLLKQGGLLIAENANSMVDLAAASSADLVGCDCPGYALATRHEPVRPAERLQ